MGRPSVQRVFGSGDRLSAIRSLVLIRIGSLAPVLTLLALVMLFSIVSPSFLTVPNLLNISAQVAILALVAGGMTFVVLGGEIDLSVANVATMAGIIMALAYNSNVPFLRSNVVTSVLLAIAASAGIGSITGLAVTKIGIPSFAATLAAMQISRGITLVFTQARPIYNVPEFLTDIGSARVGPVPFLAVLAGATLVLFHFVLRYSHFGRYVYAVGGNRMAARLVGIRVGRITFFCLVLSAIVSGVAGVLNVGRLGSAQTVGSED
ncbi:MAG: ABC transporter permease, partial [Anaerolineae bacterium]